MSKRGPRCFVESHEKYLLYIDILGFTEMVQTRPETIPKLYHIIASANVQKHGDFEVIVFSDTILVYNRYPPRSPNDKMWTVMFLCEFCQDLFYRLSTLDVFFRAVILDGDFQHYTLGSSTCFFGTGLIDAYLREKGIKAVGTFIHARCLKHSNIFDTVEHRDDFSFVILTKQLADLLQKCDNHFPIPPILLETVDNLGLGFELSALRKIRLNMDDANLRDEVRQKFSAAWQYYVRSLGRGLELLGSSGFEPSSIGLGDELDLDDYTGSTLDFPARILDSQYGYVLAFEYSDWNEVYMTATADAVLHCLRDSNFSGRCEYYQGRRQLGASCFFYVAMGLKTMKGEQQSDLVWWRALEVSVLQELTRGEVPLRASNPELSELGTLKAFRSEYDFGGAVLMRDGKPEFVIEHPSCAASSAFVEAVKKRVYGFAYRTMEQRVA